jgi:TatD DNase family protein
MIIETHCHLDYLKQLPLEEILEKTLQSGVSKIITISVEPDNLDTVLKLAETHSMIYCSQGIHPHDARLASEQHLELIKSRTSMEKVVAVGEIGLDFHYNNSPPDIQIKIFEKQMQIAVETNMPVIIHSREADDETIAILDKYAPKLARKGVIHSFTSTARLAECALKHGLMLGFNGIITFKNAHNVREIVELTPIENILVETDAPFLTPVPHRGKENAPFYLPHIIEKIAELKKLDLSSVTKQTTLNAQKLFHI